MAVWHILPIDDLEPHEEAATCRCDPKVKFDNGDTFVIHSAFDGRQALEEANEILGL